MNLDRFSRPLSTERVNPYHLQQMIQEQTELNKQSVIDDYISLSWNVYGLVPDPEEIQEHFYKMDLDMDLIEERLELF